MVNFAAPTHFPAVDGNSHSRCHERSAGDMEMANSPRNGMSVALAIVQSPRLRQCRRNRSRGVGYCKLLPFGDRIAHVNAD